MERARLKRASEALLAASKVFDTTGEVFFQSLTEHLDSVLHVDYMSWRAVDDAVLSVAVSAGGTNLDNLEYELDHTPCQQVLEHGRYFDHHEVQSRFPLDEFLVQMGFQSYLGVALADSSGVRLGVMSVMSREPLADPKIAELTLGLFAARDSLWRWSGGAGTDAPGQRSQESSHPQRHSRRHVRARPRRQRARLLPRTRGTTLYAPPEQVIGRNIHKHLLTGCRGKRHAGNGAGQ